LQGKKKMKETKDKREKAENKSNFTYNMKPWKYEKG